MGQDIKGSYLYYRNITADIKKQSGIDMKVAGQITGFNNSGLSCRFVFCSQPESFVSKVISCLPFAPDGISWPNPEDFKDDSFMYVRQPRFISKQMIRFLEQVKRINSDCKIILELPNYPYDQEMKIPLLYPAYLKDKRARKKLSTVIDRIAVIKKTSPEEIFGVPRLLFVNGIDFQRIRATHVVSDISQINIFFAAYTVKGDLRYGTDRLLEGLAQYYQNGGQRDVQAHFAIGGGEASSIERQIKNLNLESKVHFYGEVPWYKLDDITDKCTIAMAPLGLHRIGATTTSALKTREYLAKGIPFFFSGGVDVFEDHVEDFCLEIPADDSPVDIEELIKFHDSLYRKYDQEQLIQRIRNYAMKKVSVEVAMKDVISYIKENCE